MLTAVRDFFFAKRMNTVLQRNGVFLKHFIPGRMRLLFPNWRDYEKRMWMLIEEMKQDPDIHSIDFTKETGSALILFNPEAAAQPLALKRWLRVIEKYT
ncbi:HMA2 domain-containing protein [Metabacillus sp. 84]|uniref:HMA2 domain-containing protein n=1 Tax=unclassified Metabacillus TaxID=2675274 RepID=UPI003CEC10CD